MHLQDKLFAIGPMLPFACKKYPKLATASKIDIYIPIQSREEKKEKSYSLSYK